MPQTDSYATLNFLFSKKLVHYFKSQTHSNFQGIGRCSQILCQPVTHMASGTVPKWTLVSLWNPRSTERAVPFHWHPTRRPSWGLYTLDFSSASLQIILVFLKTSSESLGTTWFLHQWPHRLAPIFLCCFFALLWQNMWPHILRKDLFWLMIWEKRVPQHIPGKEGTVVVSLGRQKSAAAAKYIAPTTELRGEAEPDHSPQNMA